MLMDKDYLQKQLEKPIEVLLASEVEEKKTRRRGNKIEVNGEIREVLELSKEEVAEWFAARMPIYYEIIHELVTANDTPKGIKVKVLELITKVTGQIVEKHEVTVINPEDVARRGVEAARELEEFRTKQITSVSKSESTVELNGT